MAEAQGCLNWDLSVRYWTKCLGVSWLYSVHLQREVASLLRSHSLIPLIMKTEVGATRDMCLVWRKGKGKAFANLCISQLNRNDRISCFRAVMPLCTSYFTVIVFFPPLLTSVTQNKIFRYGFHQHILIEYNITIYNFCCSYIVFTYILGIKACILPFPIWKLSVERSLHIN